MTTVTELDLPAFDYSAPDLTGEVYHRRLAGLRERGWLARGPVTGIGGCARWSARRSPRARPIDGGR
jgi:hypothetical protein